MSKRKPPRRGTSNSKPKAKPAAKRKPAASAKKKPAARKPAARKPAARKPAAARAAAEAPLAALAATTDLRSSLTSSADDQWSFKEMFKRINLRHRPTQIAAASIGLVIILIAAAIAWPGSDKESAELATETTTETADDAIASDAPSATDDGAPAATSGPAATGPQDSVQGEDRGQALAVGAQIEPQSTSLPNGNPNTWTGVTKDAVKFAIAYDASSCGVNTLTLAQQAGANLATAGRYYRATPQNQSTARKEFREAAQQIIHVVNARALEGAEDFPKIRALMGNDPNKPFFGRKITYELVDGGSYQCPETTTAAAIKIIEDIKPFVVINDDALSRSAYNMAAALNAKAPPTTRPMHFGTLSESDALYKKWSPFAWTQFTSGTAGMRQYASWMCERVAGKNAVNAARYKGTKRKIALLYPNFQQVKIIAKELQGFAATSCGGQSPFATEIAYNPDPSRAADEGTTIAVRLKSQGYTSVAYLLDLVAPLFHIIAFSGQDYKPEFIFTPTNYMDSSTVQRLYEQPLVDKASFGITNLGVPGGFGYTAGDPFDAWHDTHKTAPSGKKCDPSSDAGMNHDEEYCKAPGAIVTLYYSVLPILAGILFSGPDLNPTNVTNGLQEYPETRFGGNGPTTDPRPALVGAGKGRHYFLTDATEWRWRSGFVSPPPESKLGWVEYPDCQRHYYMWPDKLAKYWEKSGPEYGAWCGDARFAPKSYAPKSPEKCSDTPSGVCEKDRYPRWGPENAAPK